MASTYTTNIRLEKQGDGENPNSWGAILNQNVIDLVDQAIAAYTTVSISVGDVTLTTNDGSTDQSRSAFIEFIGNLTTNINVEIPGVSKGYGIRTNFSAVSAGATITLKTAAGSGLSLPTSSTFFVVCDGVSVFGVDPGTGSLGTASTRNIGTGLENVPDVSITNTIYSRLSATNTFTATNTFSSNVSLDGSQTSFSGTNVKFTGQTVSIEASSTSFKKQMYAPLVCVSDAASITIDFRTGNSFAVTLSGNRTLTAPSNPLPGQLGYIYVYQDGTGTRTLSFNSVYKFVGGTSVSLTPSANAVDLLAYSVRTSSAIDIFPAQNLS